MPRLLNSNKVQPWSAHQNKQKQKWVALKEQVCRKIPTLISSLLHVLKMKVLANGTTVRHKRTKKIGVTVGNIIKREVLVMPHGDGYRVQFDSMDSDLLEKVYIKHLVHGAVIIASIFINHLLTGGSRS